MNRLNQQQFFFRLEAIPTQLIQMGGEVLLQKKSLYPNQTSGLNSLALRCASPPR